MTLLRLRTLGRTLTVAGSTIATGLALALPAQAHEPVLLDSTDVLPSTAPLIVDGTDAVALFGVLPRPAEVRSAQLHLVAGQPLVVGYAIPNQAPENTLATQSLPRVVLLGPDGSVQVLSPTVRVPIHNEDFDQDYLALSQYSATAVTGTYSILVTGVARSRFIVTTGVEGQELGTLRRGVVASQAQIEHWYAVRP